MAEKDLIHPLTRRLLWLLSDLLCIGKRDKFYQHAGHVNELCRYVRAKGWDSKITQRVQDYIKVLERV